MRVKKILCSILAIAMMLSTMSTVAFADETTPVAMVGDTEYATIDEAIAKWTDGTTLTLLSDVTLPDVYKFKSTESRTLNLGTYTMTAASGQHAIEIECNGQPKATYGLIVNADSQNPGGITATGKSCIYYRKSGTTQDRVLIQINGGVFNGSYAVNVYSSNRGTNCPQVNIAGGIFNGNVNIGHGKLMASGGTFNGWVNCTGDSTAYRQISGGTYKSWQFMTADATNKFWVGTSQANYNVGVFVNNDGYLVVGGPVITEMDCRFEAVLDYSKWSSYLKYSSAAANGLYYTSVDIAFEDLDEKGELVLNTSASTDITTSSNLKIDMSDPDADYTGNVTLGGKNHTFTVVFDSENPYEGTVTPYTGYALAVTETMGTTITRTYSNVEAYAKIGDTNYASIEDAITNVQAGETITLLKDIELEKSISFTKDIDFTIDGNGKKIAPSATSTEANSAFNLGQGNDDTRATKKYNLKNIVFDGWTTDHVVRLQGTTSAIENCEFINCNQPDGLGLLTVTFADAIIKDCTFKDNTCVKAIDFNSWGDGSTSVNIVDECKFENNNCSGPGVILHSDGENLKVKNSDFIDNTVTTNGNAAVAYMGWGDGFEVSGCIFKDNDVITSHETTKRFASAIFCDGCVVKENAFINNTATRNGESISTIVAVAAYYGAADVSENYWNSNSTEPEAGIDFTHEYPTNNALVIDNYYTEINFDADGNFTLSNLKYIVKDVKLDFVDVTASDAEGEKVYNINITAPGKIINRLNSVDLSFVHTKIEGDTDFEIIASNPEVVINPVDNSPVRYEFHYNGKTDVESDTAETITIGQVKFTGYGEFNFVVDSSVDTNAAHATKNDNNIVDTFVPGGNTEFNYGTFDVSDSDITDIEIAVPTRTLTINITFPNAVENNNVDYQDMTVTIVGGTVNETIALGTDGEAYNFTRELPYNTAYTVTVSGAGYRTARYTVNLNDHKQLNFWNNVKDEAQVVEIGKDSSIAKVTFLAGDIVKDNNINIYDLSAVVSYFGEELDTAAYNEYAKYDLNRDGVIDSKDVAYVLVSWNN